MKLDPGLGEEEDKKLQPKSIVIKLSLIEIRFKLKEKFPNQQKKNLMVQEW